MKNNGELIAMARENMPRMIVEALFKLNWDLKNDKNALQLQLMSYLFQVVHECTVYKL